jgi:hypothetical protein
MKKIILASILMLALFQIKAQSLEKMTWFEPSNGKSKTKTHNDCHATKRLLADFALWFHGR